jgi:hypothetical protein
MKVERTSYPGWVGHPTYLVRTFRDWEEVCMWMYRNQVEHFLLSSGSAGYTFQVRDKKEWFELKWG